MTITQTFAAAFPTAGNTSPGPKPTHVPDGPTLPTIHNAHGLIVDNPPITPATAITIGHGRGDE